EHQPFGPLLDYWVKANTRGRHVWPGLFTSKLDSSPKSWEVDEVLGQIALTREHEKPPERGVVHFSMVSLLQNRKGIADRLKAGPYATDALVPAFPWLDATAPKPPRVAIDIEARERIKVRLSVLLDEPTTHYAIWTRQRGAWHFTSLPTSKTELDLESSGLDA